jgi:hypothetical protein
MERANNLLSLEVTSAKQMEHINPASARKVRKAHGESKFFCTPEIHSVLKELNLLALQKKGVGTCGKTLAPRKADLLSSAS